MEIQIEKDREPDTRPCDFAYKAHGSWFIEISTLEEFADTVKSMGPFSVMANTYGGFEILLDEETYCN